MFILQTSEQFLWADGKPLIYNNWKRSPKDEGKEHVTKKSCVSHFLPDYLSDGGFHRSTSDCVSTEHQFTHDIMRRDHPIRSPRFKCTALILNDIHHEEIISIPCNEVILVNNNEMITLVCQSEAHTNDSVKPTPGDSLLLATSTQTHVCKLGYVYIIHSCYKLLSDVMSVQQENFGEICRSEDGGVANIYDIYDNSGDKGDFILIYILHWLYEYYFSVIVADESGDEAVNVQVVYGHLSQPFSVRQTNVSKSSTDRVPHWNVLCVAEAKARTVFCNQGMFQCNDKSCILDQFLCDGHPDCGQSEDESDCSVLGHQESLLNTSCSLPHVLCLSGECIHPGMYCDGKPDCFDGLDEFSCAAEIVHKVREWANLKTELKDVRFEAFIDAPEPYANVRSVCAMANLAPCPLNPNLCYPRNDVCVFDRHSDGTIRYCAKGGHLGFDHCPRHECPGLFKCAKAYCVPLHMLCDGEFDCPSGEDEDGCAGLKLLPCPGMLRCRDESHCVHPHYYNDGVAQCPLYKDDEKVLDTLTCPSSCICVTSSFMCDGFNVMEIPNWVKFQYLHVLILRRTQFNLTSNSFAQLINLQILRLSSNKYKSVPDRVFDGPDNIIHLDLSSNHLTHLQTQLFKPLKNLLILDLSDNSFSKMEFHSYCNPGAMAPSLRYLNLANNGISHVTNDACVIPSLIHLNLTRNLIEHVYIDGDWSGNISSDIPNICCFIVNGCPDYKQSGFSICGGLLGGSTAKSTLWILTVAGLSFNTFVFYWWFKHKVGSEISRLQTKWLSLCDILICVYSTIILGVDSTFRLNFPMLAVKWQEGVFCSVLASLISFSYLALIYTKCIIALDRYVLLKKSVSRVGFEKRTIVKMFVLGSVLIAIMSVIPTITKHAMEATQKTSGTCMSFIYLYTNDMKFWYHIMIFYLPIVVMTLGTFVNNVLVILKSSSRINKLSNVGSVAGEKRQSRLRILKWKCLITLILDSLFCIFTLAVEVYMKVSMSEPMMERLYEWLVLLVLLISPLTDPFVYTVSTTNFVNWLKSFTSK